MKRSSLLIVMLFAARAWGQSAAELHALYQLRGDRPAFTGKAEQLGYSFVRDRAQGTAYSAFAKGNTRLLLVKWNDDVVLRFKEVSGYGAYMKELKDSSFTCWGTWWYTKDEARHYTKDSLRVVLWRYDFRTMGVHYGISLLRDTVPDRRSR